MLCYHIRRVVLVAFDDLRLHGIESGRIPNRPRKLGQCLSIITMAGLSKFVAYLPVI